MEKKYYSKEEKKDFLEERAEIMRNNPTPGEIRFKQFCDKYSIQYRFQVPIIIGFKGIILDFEIITKNNPRFKGSKKRKMAVEIDGDYHNTKEQMEKDKARSKTLTRSRYKVLRLTNEETELESIIKRKLKEFCIQIGEKELLSKLNSI